MKEIWKDIKDYVGLYQASNLGRIKRLRYKVKRKNPNNQNKEMKFTVPERILKQARRNKFGYTVVSLSKKNVVVNISVHRLIAQTFIPNPNNKPQVGHLDNNTANNEAKNLVWNTQGENLKHCFKCKRRNHSGEKHPMHKLTEKDVKYIRAHYKLGDSKKLGEKFGMSPRSISDIICRRSWKHI